MSLNRGNKIAPNFYSHLIHENTSGKDYFESIRAYFALAESCPDESFEIRIKNLYEVLHGQKDSSDTVNAVLQLFIALLNLYKRDEDTALTVLNSFSKDYLIHEYFKEIYDLVVNILTADWKVIEPPMVRIVVSRKFDQSNFGLTGQNLKQLSFTRYSKYLEVFDSQEISIEKALNDSSIIFFLGHGFDAKDGGFKYCHEYTDGFYLRGELIKALTKKTPLLIGLMSCGILPYENIQDLAEYLILPTNQGSNLMYEEAFIKGFLLWYDRLDIENCIRLGIIAVMIRSTNELLITVLNKNRALIL
jgi:hypothetical protein